METTAPNNIPLSQTEGPIYVTSPKYKKIGIFLLVAPWIGLILDLLLFAIVNSAFKGNTESNFKELELVVFNFLLSIFGFICVIGILLGIPLSIIFLKKKVLADGARYDVRSGKKGQSEVPAEIKG